MKTMREPTLPAPGRLRLQILASVSFCVHRFQTMPLQPKVSRMGGEVGSAERSGEALSRIYLDWNLGFGDSVICNGRDFVAHFPDMPLARRIRRCQEIQAEVIR